MRSFLVAADVLGLAGLAAVTGGRRFSRRTLGGLILRILAVREARRGSGSRGPRGDSGPSTALRHEQRGAVLPATRLLVLLPLSAVPGVRSWHPAPSTAWSRASAAAPALLSTCLGCQSSRPRSDEPMRIVGRPATGRYESRRGPDVELRRAADGRWGGSSTGTLTLILEPWQAVDYLPARGR